MKSNLFKITLLLVVILGIASGFSFKKTTGLSKYLINDVEFCYQVPNKNEVHLLHPEKPSYYIFLGKSFLGFKEAIGFKESRGDYSIVNIYGYLGKYQFGRSTLKGLGFAVTRKEFLSNPQLQEEAMMALLLHNKEKLQKYIDVFDGQTVNGMYISESGILAAAHLGGQGSVKRYFKNGKVFKDGNGTKITSYMNKFSGYEIKLKPNS